MRILLLGSLAESLVNFRGDLMRQLRKEGHVVIAAAPPGPDFVDQKLASWGIRRLCIELDRSDAGIIGNLLLIARLHSLFRDLKPDIILAYTIKPVVFGSIVARWAGVPRFAAMITGLGFSFSSPTSKRQFFVRATTRILYKLAMRRATVIFFQNPDDVSDFRRSGMLSTNQRVITTHGSGVNLDHFAQKPMPEGPIRFLMIARLLADKGVREYMAAAQKVKQIHPQVQFDLVGPYDSHPSALSYTELDSAVAVGYLTYHGATYDVRPFLHRCKVFVLPSYREGTPRSVLEAMAIGRPIITTDVPGCRETVIAGSNGLLVAPASVPALVSAMLFMIAAGPAELQRMAEASRKIAESKFDVVAVNQQICAALTETE